MYRQCELRRGTTEQIVWIPEQFAAAGRWIRINDEDGWNVTAVFSRSNGVRLFADGRSQRGLFGSLN